MFEMKKQSSLKIIAKKEKKVQEIQRVLDEEITPTLENLRKERTHYMKWTNNQIEIEKLTRFTVAYEYIKSQEIIQTSLKDVEKMEEKQEELKKNNKKLNKNLNEIKEKIKKLSEQKEKVCIIIIIHKNI